MRRGLRLFRGTRVPVNVVCLAAGLGLVPVSVVADEPRKQKTHLRVKKPSAAQAAVPDRINLLVHITPGANRGPVRAFAANQGGFVKYEYRTAMPHVMSLRDVPAAAVPALRNLPGVIDMQEDKYHEKVTTLHDSTPLIQGLQEQVSGAGFSADGSGVRVCIIDSGIDMDNGMYASRIDLAASYDFHNDDADPEDDFGHGAHVAGIALGRTGLEVDFGCVGSEPFQGVAPEATLIGVKVLDSSGGGLESNIIAGIDHCADPALPGGQADVINLSLGDPGTIVPGTCDTHPWAEAANNAVDAGVVVVAASGNECESNAMRSPACASQTIAVGATYDENFPNCEDGTGDFGCLLYPFFSCYCDDSPNVDDVTGFSNRSDELDVTAPGAVIYSTATDPGGDTIVPQSGTSMAAPQVSGLAALILSADPSLTPSEVRQIIRDGAIDLGPPGFDSAYGFGRIDVLNSLSLLGPACSLDADCDDGLFCNGAETCDPDNGCQAGGSPCPTEVCDEANDDCDDDEDDDGVLDEDDVCDFTPPDAIERGRVVMDPDDCLYGTIRGDFDGDCDCDLEDYAEFQLDFDPGT